LCTCGRRSAAISGVGSVKLVYVFTMPLFSATNTRPLGATSTSIGFSSPVIRVVCWKPAGSVTAPAMPGMTSMARHASKVAIAARKPAVCE
jgi:hypothetical protein